MSHSSPSHEDPASLLAWYVAMGADEAHLDEPVDRFSIVSQHATDPPSASATTASEVKAAPKPVSAKAAASVDFDATLKQAEQLAASCTSLNELKDAITSFDGCSLKSTSTNTVFAGGTEGAELMVISAAAGADEDRTGIAFQGIGGQLLDKMIGAIGFTRDNNAYMAHVVPWRPLGNRNPDPQSMALCRPFMMKHIELAKPKAILLLGNATTRSLCESDTLIARMRGKWHTLAINGQEFAAIPTYHPDYLLKHPRYKRDSWQDLLALKDKLKV